jgi:hypothetical protein
MEGLINVRKWSWIESASLFGYGDWYRPSGKPNS